MSDSVSFSDLSNNFILSKHSDLEIFRANNQLIPAILVVVSEHQRGDIVPGHCPEGIITFMIKSQQ